MRKRTRYTLLAVLLLLLALAVALYLRLKAPPEAARLLPESDAIVFLNLKPLRAATHFDRTSVARSSSYQQFIDSTGIVFERDLDQAAFALHQMPNPAGPNGPVAFSEVFVGHFDTPRLTQYLASLATAQEPYADRIIYAIPSQGRTLRVALLDYETVAASNMPTPEQIHSILDRSRAAASPFAGSSLLNARFADVPAFSSAWGIGRIALPFVQNGRISVLGLELPLPADATLVASLRFTTGLHLRIDDLVATDDEAAQTTSSLNALLSLFRSLQAAQQPVARTPSDIAVRSFVDSIQIAQHHTRTTLTATLPPEALRRLTTPQ